MIKRFILDALGLACCAVPPILVAVDYFPIWKQSGVPALAGGSLAIVAIITVIIMGKYLKVRVKSPSPVVVFLICWGLFSLIEQTVTGLKTIAFWGMVGSAVGMVFFWLSDKTVKK